MTLTLLLGFRPYQLKKHTFLASVVSILHLIVYGICVAFVYSEGVKPIPRAVLGFVCLAVQSIGVLLIFFFALWTLLFFIIWSVLPTSCRSSSDIGSPGASSIRCRWRRRTSTGPKRATSPPSRPVADGVADGAVARGPTVGRGAR